MKFTVIFGSPRKNGNTASLVAPFMDELKKNGAEIDYFDVWAVRKIKQKLAALLKMIWSLFLLRWQKQM